MPAGKSLSELYMQNPDSIKKREAAAREFKELLFPIALSALAAAGLYKGVKWAKNLKPAEPGAVKTTQDILSHISGMGKSSDKDILFQLTKQFDRTFPGR